MLFGKGINKRRRKNIYTQNSSSVFMGWVMHAFSCIHIVDLPYPTAMNYELLRSVGK